VDVVSYGRERDKGLRVSIQEYHEMPTEGDPKSGGISLNSDGMANPLPAEGS
jgi:hypothetical protein